MHNSNTSGSGMRERCASAALSVKFTGTLMLMSPAGILWRRQRHRRVRPTPPTAPRTAPLGGPP